jgi:preprotein translocase subunit SecF
MKIFDKLPHFDFMRWKGLALAISWGIIILCFVVVAPWKGERSRVKLGMQFIGGIDMKVRLKGDVPQDRVREALQRGGVQDAAVVTYDSATPGTLDYSIKVKAAKGQDAKDATTQLKQIVAALKVLDPEAAAAKADLNLEAAGNLADRWFKANALGKSGEEAAVRAEYLALASKVTGAREAQGIYTDFKQLPADLPPALRADLEGAYRLGPLAIVKNESFSPSISGEWTRKTLTAVAWAMGAILLYVMFRFTMSFAIGGIVALVHDILMALGLFALFGFEFSVPVVASFLILMGYSMADTIVVFDRIRENSHKSEYRRASITQLVNDSINQTLSRTILTSCSVLFVAFCLFVWGGPALRDLSFPIFVGVITGTYSSIYIASPVVVYWDQFFGGKDKLKQTSKA